MLIPLLVAILLAVLALPRAAHAVPPPDFIFSVGSSLVLAFSFLSVAGSILIGSIRRFFRNHPFFTRRGPLFWPVSFLVVIAVSAIGAGLYSAHQQHQDYLTWVKQSLQQPKVEVASQAPDQLVVSTDAAPTNQAPVNSTFQPAAASTNPDEELINLYYQNIGSGRLAEAYAVWTQTVTEPVYASWYEHVTGARINSVQHISDRTYSINVTLQEGDQQSTYGALLTLADLPNGSVHIVESTARLLSSSSTVTNDIAPTTNFYESNKDAALAITNKDFSALTKGGTPYVLDAREDEEFAYGQYPGSTHIRYADLVAGEWIRLPVDQPVYVICWSGIRGQEVAKFLRTKKIVARYLENGANSWVKDGGAWNGEILFEKIYTESQYKVVFNKKTVQNDIKKGVVLVDSRPEEKYNQFHIPGSISLAMLYTPTSKIAAALEKVPAGTEVITVCDDFVSCFDARVTGIRLEKAGHKFLGRYNRPWEFR